MALKAQRELEQKVHEEFYKNVHILTLVYSPSEAFKQVFKKDMFVKSNKAGFQQVVYYLLSILDPDQLKQKVPTWPPYDLRLENQFRNEVMKYINELNSIYENANIPPLATSHVISPGGYKFVKFMFKLSQFVLFECLWRNPDISSCMLLPLKPCKKDVATSENLEKLQLVTNKIKRETEKKKTAFEDEFSTAKLEAQRIIAERDKKTKQLKESQSKLALIKKEFKDLPMNYEEMNKMSEIKKKLSALYALKEQFVKCSSLDSLLGSDRLRLEHNKEMKLPSDLTKIVHVENGVLDLTSLMEGCFMLIDRKRLEVKPMSEENILKQTERFKKLNERLTLMSKDQDELHADLVKLCDKLQKETLENSNIQKRKPLRSLQLNDNDSDSIDSAVLAVPLSPSPSPSKKSFNFDL